MVRHLRGSQRSRVSQAPGRIEKTLFARATYGCDDACEQCEGEEEEGRGHGR